MSKVQANKLMMWTTLTFGRHTGRTLPQVVWTDPDWFFWAYEAGVFLERPWEQQEADVIFSRARRIRVRQSADEKLVVEYGIDLRGRYANIEVVPEGRAQHRGSTRTVRLPYFDLSFPRRLAPYDKSGCRALVRAVKFYVFGDPDYRLTRERSEAFFEDDGNFILGNGNDNCLRHSDERAEADDPECRSDSNSCRQRQRKGP